MLRNGQKTWVTELVSIVAACKTGKKTASYNTAAIYKGK